MKARTPQRSPRPDGDRATALLLAIAGSADPALAQAFDTILYPYLYAFVLRRHATLGHQAAARVGGRVVNVPDADLEAVAHDAVVTGLRRARASAGRFDPAKGDAVDWCLRAVIFAFRDEALGHAGARKKLKTEPTADEELVALAGHVPYNMEDRIADALGLDKALLQLTSMQRKAWVLHDRFGCPAVEVADILLGSRGTLALAQVEDLLVKARSRLADLLREES